MKKIIIIIIVLVALVGLYLAFFSKPKEVNNSTLSSNPLSVEKESENIGREFLNTLLNLNGIKLDNSLFASPVFTSLQDYTIDLEATGNEGRPNPFAPISSQNSSAMTDMETADNSQ